MDIEVRSNTARALKPEQRAHQRIGEILQARGHMAESDVRRILTLQSKRSGRFGDLALELKLVTAEQLREALAQQFHYPVATAQSSSLSPLLVAAYEPASAYAEALRTLRSQLLLRWFGAHGSMLAVVAAHAQDNHSVLAANLAITFAQLGERTLLIDLNLRKPRQQVLFGLQSRRGMTDLLGEHLELHELSIEKPFTDLHVLCSGTTAPNPLELLSRARLARVLSDVSAQFDAVIVDTPPLNDCADAQIITARVGGAVLSVRRNRTTAADVQRARDSVTATGSTLLGAVLAD